MRAYLVWGVRRSPKVIPNALRDLRYGWPLAGTIKTRYAHLGARNTTNADYGDLALLFAAAEVQLDDVIVDVGCGKGRALNWFLGHFPGNRIIGIELDPEICARTARRLRRHRQVTVVCGDASTMLPRDATLFYLFNPFDRAATMRFRDALLEARAGAIGRTRIVYYFARELAVFEQDTRFAVEYLRIPRLTLPSALIDVRLRPGEPRHSCATAFQRRSNQG